MKLKTVFRVLAVAALLVGCGTLVDMSGGELDGVERRVYVNDAAPNESLPSVIIDQDAGVYFAMHPGKSYRLRVRTPTVGQQLQVLRLRGGYYYSWKVLNSTSEGDSVQFFTLSPDAGDSTTYYRAVLQSGGGTNAARPQTVRLVPTTPVRADSLRVKLVLVRRFNSLGDAQKEAFAQAFLAELASVYDAYGIKVTGRYEIAEPTGSPLVVDFGGGLGDYNAVRRGDTAYMYVVDNVRIDGQLNSDLLGFAPREGFTLREDYVVLNASGVAGVSTPQAKGVRLAVTAAHELGHLFGLRHTRPSGRDYQAEYDKSNTHDGFDAPEQCAPLPKGNGAPDLGEHTEIRVGDRVYCLRVSITEEDYCGCSDRTNLMYAYACNSFVQKTMSAGQRDFLRWNITLFR